jgi:hypothetical protein
MVLPSKYLSFNFITDYSVTRKGFHFKIKSVNDPSCDISQIPAPICNHNLKIWQTTEKFDKITQPSKYVGEEKFHYDSPSDLDRLNICNDACKNTAGCFKFRINDVSMIDTVSCSLRGNNLQPTDHTYALTGENCDGSKRWIDWKSESTLYCLFYTDDAAENLLNELKEKNPQQQYWVSSSIGDQYLTSSQWNFTIAAEREHSTGKWFKFSKVTYYREHLTRDDQSNGDIQFDVDVENTIDSATTTQIVTTTTQTTYSPRIRRSTNNSTLLAISEIEQRLLNEFETTLVIGDTPVLNTTSTIGSAEEIFSPQPNLFTQFIQDNPCPNEMWIYSASEERCLPIGVKTECFADRVLFKGHISHFYSNAAAAQENIVLKFGECVGSVNPDNDGRINETFVFGECNGKITQIDDIIISWNVTASEDAAFQNIYLSSTMSIETQCILQERVETDKK